MVLAFLVPLMKIMMVNIVLSGDNAVVIALAARNLPAHQQKRAILWGSGGAIVLRVLLTIAAVYLLSIPFLQFFGALLLIWIAVKLLIEDDEVDEASLQSKGNFLSAVKTILIADAVMSLDNTLAIAGVAKGNWTLLIAGLVLSIPLIIFGSTIIMKLIERFPAIVYFGAGLIAFTAGEMIVSDAAVMSYLPAMLHHTPYLGIALVLSVVGFGGWYNTRTGQESKLAYALERSENQGN